MATGISYPETLPAFLAEGHNREEVPAFELAELEQGAPRWTRRFTSTPQFADVSTWLKQADFDTFHDWYEGALKAGALTFNVQIAGPSFTSGLEWWEARFVAPYSTPYKNGRGYLVSARLRLVDGPFETRPLGPLAAEGDASAAGDADITVAHGLAAEGTADATGDADLAPIPQGLAAEGTAAATGDAQIGIPADLAAEGAASATGDADLTTTAAAGTADLDLARSWMGLNYTQASVAANDDALAAEWMGF